MSSIFMAGNLNDLSPHADFFTLSFSFILSFDLPMCGNEQVVIFIPTNVQFENVSFFIKVSDEEKFLLFQYGERTSHTFKENQPMHRRRNFLKENFNENS